MANRTSAPGRPAKARAPHTGGEVQVLRHPSTVREPWSEAPSCNLGERGATPRRTFFAGCSSGAERCVWGARAAGASPATPKTRRRAARASWLVAAASRPPRKVNRRSQPDAPGTRDVPRDGAWGASPPPSFPHTWGRGETRITRARQARISGASPDVSICPRSIPERCACLVSRRTRCNSGRGLSTTRSRGRAARRPPPKRVHPGAIPGGSKLDDTNTLAHSAMQ